MYKPKEITKIGKIFKSLGNERRLKILSLLLSEGSMSVSRISERINLSLKSTSKHVIILDRAGFIEGKQQGLKRIYEVEEGIKKILFLFFKSFT